MIDVLFETPIAEVIDRYMHRRAAQAGALRAGHDRCWAGPAMPGHRVDEADALPGRAGRRPQAWGYVEGGMGRISFAIAEARP